MKHTAGSDAINV